MSIWRRALLSGVLLGLLGVLLVNAAWGSVPTSTTSLARTPQAKEKAEPSAQFLVDPGAGKYVRFGVEASAHEREKASKVVSGNLKARAAGNFATQCETLAMKAFLEVQGAEGGQGCPIVLRALAEPLSGTKKIRKDTLKGPITALRVKGNFGYALFHGSDHKDHAMEMEKEAGAWKVASIVTIEL